MVADKPERIKVLVRVRPSNSAEEEHDTSLELKHREKLQGVIASAFKFRYYCML